MLGTTIVSAAVTLVSAVSRYHHGKKSCKINKDGLEITNSTEIEKIIDDCKTSMKCYDLLSEVFDDVKKGDLIRASSLLDDVDTLNRDRDSEIAQAVLFWRDSIERQKKLNSSI